MARRARIVLPGTPHYILQSGWQDRHIFFDIKDSGFYQDILLRNSASAGLQILAYCFMPTEIHLLGIPLHKHSLRKAIGDTNRQYTRKIREEDKIDHNPLWAERFHSCPVEGIECAGVIQYIEWLPVITQQVKYPHQWHYSSARARALEKNDPLITPHPLLDELDWVKVQTQRPDYPLLNKLTAHQSTGRPIGSRQFIEKLERDLGQRLRPRKRGRRPAAKPLSPELNTVSIKT